MAEHPVDERIASALERIATALEARDTSSGFDTWIDAYGRRHPIIPGGGKYRCSGCDELVTTTRRDSLGHTDSGECARARRALSERRAPSDLHDRVA